VTTDARAILRAAYPPLIEFAERVDDEVGWRATELPGWCVRDLIFHLLGDAQRALVALAVPSDAATDTDEVTYWLPWRPGTEGAAAGLRGTRISASAWSSVRGPAELYVETARAVLAVVERADLERTVTTQGRRLTGDALVRTLAIEAVIHHYDFGASVPNEPNAVARAEMRRVLDALLGRPAPAHWPDARYVRLATGRLPLEATERAELGEAADRLPLFG
jgi:hypothetical protein